MKPARILLVALPVLLVLAAALYFVHPVAPLLLLFSLLVQLPIIAALVSSSFTGSYRQRAEERLRRYGADGDAAAWLAEEQAEAKGVGFAYWSSAGRALNTIARAEALCALGRRDEAAALLDAVEAARVDKRDAERYGALRRQLRGLPAALEPQPPEDV